MSPMINGSLVNPGSDAAKRALHTLWQTFVAAFAVTYIASGLDVSQINDMAGLKKFLLSVISAAVAAVLSIVKTYLVSKRQPTEPGV